MQERVTRTGFYIFKSLSFAVIFGTLLMVLAYCIPVEPIRAHVLESAHIYEIENDDYMWAPSYRSSRLDNFTDALILNEASFVGTGSVIADAMNNPYIRYDSIDSFSMTLIQSVSENGVADSEYVVNYARYWHGLIAILKPLLCVFTVSDIRILNMIIQIGLTALLSIELYKAGGYQLAISTLTALLVINPISTALCLQYTSVYIITVIGAIVLLHVWEFNDIWKLFLWIGIITAFLDLMTYPLAGLGINLLLLLYLRRSDRISQQLKIILACSFSWGGGYMLMWISKWLVSTLLTGNNVIMDGIASAGMRLMGDSMAEAGVDSSTIWLVVNQNLRQVLIKPYIIAGIVAICILMYVGSRFGRFRVSINLILPTAIVGAYPFVWYAVIRNHSAIHSWMTYRDLSITILAICLIIANLFGSCMINIGSVCNNHDDT